jgi:hypothetical protein
MRILRSRLGIRNTGSNKQNLVYLRRCKSTGGNHEQDVEDRRPDDGADADVADGDEDADDGGEELGGGSAGRH